MDSAGEPGREKSLSKAHLSVTLLAACAGIALVLYPAAPVHAQGKGGGKGGGRGGAAKAKQTARAAAPIDLTGSWVSVVTEDWMFRMVTPPKGQFLGVPMTPAARAAANNWDPARDEAEGNACKAYGAPAIMRVPGRIRVSWQDDSTLKMETEAGMQTRLFHFDESPAPAEPTWQGHSVAEWEIAATGRGAPRAGSLKVTTTGLRAGYLRKNGVPYSAGTLLTEYYDVHTAPNGDIWMVVTTQVHDPVNLTTDFITSSHFKKLAPGDTTWRPEPCAAR